MRSLLIGAALIAFGSCAALAQQTPDPNAAITTPSTPAPAVNSPDDTSMKTKMSGKHHGLVRHGHMGRMHRRHTMKRPMMRHHMTRHHGSTKSNGM